MRSLGGALEERSGEPEESVRGTLVEPLDVRGNLKNIRETCGNPRGMLEDLGGTSREPWGNISR